jgi:alpha-beta hydrolase superfamily lysophospholipase
VVVLVHGSGPHDRDETIGPRKPLRDVAWGLATQGIGVLRYVKRTRLHAARMHRDSVTIEQETVADALVALAAARMQPEADSARVYLLGHSLGAMIAPEIAVRDGGVAGVIMMAPAARPLAEVILEQLDYVITLPENESPAAREQIGKLRALVERVASGEAPPGDQALGAPAAYFYDLNERAAPRRALDFAGPILVLQGERDYQVTMEDFRIWQETLAGRANVVFRSYPALDHLFVAGDGTSTPRETMTVPGFVAQEVVADIAAFVRRQWPGRIDPNPSRRSGG